MTANGALRTGLTASGNQMPIPTQEVSRQRAEHSIDNAMTFAMLPGDDVTRACLELSAGMLDGQDIPAKTGRLADAASEWAREGVPIDTILHAIHEGLKLGMDLTFSNATVKDYADLVDGVKLVVELLDIMSATVARAYVREHKAAVSEHHTAVHTLTSALLGGYTTATTAREYGIGIAEQYSVLAVDVPKHPDELHPMLDGKVVARRKLRRLQAELATRCGENALALLSVDGGTILIPTATLSDECLDELLAELSAAARVPVTAVVVTASATAVPGAADRAHELLDMVRRLQCAPALYRFADMALEYQLTRPGPGRESLGALLDPLDDHPELFQTLRSYISNNLNRQRTARSLQIHTNTVDYRLRRIGQVTGLDPTTTTGVWQLRSALVARTFTRRSRSDIQVDAV
ncbi:helix-turn-helix domain-containing protein [Nocardia beijingensis]|uniref:PucR family transcriptional regulator n=1 Tax=Nocardia beijingensis TaxID=95162 RepID=UPI0018935661|nr:helix-turn-helix domain-containing protein [Nocardia beijingensis]MBF6467361.1 helix-turn-helix domain-containing protein [Nocardia beijingensis]